MRNMIDCFFPLHNWEKQKNEIKRIADSPLVNKLFIGVNDDLVIDLPNSKCSLLRAAKMTESAILSRLSRSLRAPYSLIDLGESPFCLGHFALERMLSIATDSDAVMLYCDFYEKTDDGCKPHPVIDYQLGSLRDDFDFGSLIFYKTEAFVQAITQPSHPYKYAAWYDLRLKLSRVHLPMHVNEYLYTREKWDNQQGDEKIFAYVDPQNRSVQLEMEAACTAHLKEIDAFLKPDFLPVRFAMDGFPVEASVIIPVYNRVKTIADAIESVLRQKCNFEYNVIVVDNHSTDGTTDEVTRFLPDKRVIHVCPERDDLAIGGCWNMGVENAMCGKFAVQLDSDDVYSDENALQKIVNVFYAQKCAMVVGTYLMTDFEMNPIPPGVIDHKEWSPNNGRNNALRINGLGAPRAFYTPLLREIKVPNTSYGADYALGLRFSREYQIGRVYDVVYCCRRWDGKSDAALDIVRMNLNNTYKDRIRTWEVEARCRMNKAKRKK